MSSLAGVEIVVLDSQGDVVTSVISASGARMGQFRVDVVPGEYALVPQPVPGMLTADPVTLTLPRDEPVPVVITYETRMR